MGENYSFTQIFKNKAMNGARIYIRKLKNEIEIVVETTKNKQKQTIKLVQKIYN